MVFGKYLDMLDKLAIVDIETTGLRAPRDRIIEVGIVLVDKNKITKTWSQLINPGTGVNPYILQMTRIDRYQLTKAPTFAQIADELKQLLAERIFIAHNVRFDYGFIRSEFKQLDSTFSAPHVCSVRLSRKLYPKDKGHGLDRIIKRFNFDITNRHRALDDAQIVWQFIDRSQQLLGEKQVQTAFNAILKKPALPTQLDDQQIQSLPECPGVYLFYDDNHTLLYVGKSIDIKARVRSHFYDDLHNHKELKIKQKVAKIETITTGGELEALMLESKLIKQLQPVYNHQLRRYRTLHSLVIRENSHGYKTPVYKPTESFIPDDMKDSIALFRTKRQLQSALEKISDEHRLCKKLMGIEKTSSSCFGYRLKTCAGACVAKEPIEEYNHRFTQAFSQLAIPYWPYNSSIVICEENEITGQRSLLVFNKWSYVGKLDEESGELNSEEMTFDYDTYKILKLFIKKHKHVIHPLTH